MQDHLFPRGNTYDFIFYITISLILYTLIYGTYLPHVLTLIPLCSSREPKMRAMAKIII